MLITIVKIKILIYCLGLLTAGFVIAAHGSNNATGKIYSRQTIVKDSTVEIFISENPATNQAGGKTNYALIFSGFQSSFLSLDFQIEPIVAYYENLFRTNRRFAANLKT
ncbi:MAG: hypothetical protein FD143_2147 [Ignavibacteria bacterium]|nr:MAG: hypothetical protein FD143_2147 [Ignavibacteria bacterium]KAF0158899.1 MAG: hypothetical protein FD188_2381 [Ignavibacteria bacterium]